MQGLILSPFFPKNQPPFFLTVWSPRGGLGGGVPSEQVVPRSYAKPAHSRGLYSQRCYLLMLSFTQHEMFFCIIFKADCKKKNIDIEAIPNRLRFGIALFLPGFFILFSIQIGFRRVCADANFGIRVEGRVL